MNLIFACLCGLLSRAIVASEPSLLQEWTFDKGLQGWASVNTTPLEIHRGVLRFATNGGDAHIASPLFELRPTPDDIIEIRIRSTTAGMGEWFWRETTEGHYGGFEPNRRRSVFVEASGEFRILRSRPFWHECKKIIGLRFDVPEGTPGTYEVASVRILRLGPGGIAASLPSSSTTAPATGFEFQTHPRRSEYRLVSAPPRIDIAAQTPPPTRPVPSDFTIAMWYFAAWEPEYTWDGWKQVAERSPWRIPLLYDSKDPAMSFNGIQFYRSSHPRAIDWHVHWMREHAINLMLWDWYPCVRKDGSFDPTSFTNRALEVGFLGKAQCGGPPVASNRFADTIRFAVMWTNHSPHHRLCAGLGDYLVRQFFVQPNYYRVDDRPLLILWSVDLLVQEAGGVTQARDVLDRIRTLASDQGLAGLYITAIGETRPELLRRLAIDGVMGYNYIGSGGTQVEMRPLGNRVVEDHIEDFPSQTIPGHVRTWTRCAESFGRDYLLATTPMQNWEPTFRPANPTMVHHTPDTYRELLRRAKLFIEQRGLRRFVSIEAWNEWLEGSYVEPSTQWGLSCLEAVRDIFGRTGK